MILQVSVADWGFGDGKEDAVTETPEEKVYRENKALKRPNLKPNPNPKVYREKKALKRRRRLGIVSTEAPRMRLDQVDDAGTRAESVALGGGQEGEPGQVVLWFNGGTGVGDDVVEGGLDGLEKMVEKGKMEVVNLVYKSLMSKGNLKAGTLKVIQDQDQDQDKDRKKWRIEMPIQVYSRHSMT